MLNKKYNFNIQMTTARHQHQVCYLHIKDIVCKQNHDVVLYNNQVEYRHQTQGRTSETYSAIHLAYNKKCSLLFTVHR